MQALRTAMDVYHVTPGPIAPSGWAGVRLHAVLGVWFFLVIMKPDKAV